jgi:hypothetical protein
VQDELQAQCHQVRVPSTFCSGGTGFALCANPRGAWDEAITIQRCGVVVEKHSEGSLVEYGWASDIQTACCEHLLHMEDAHRIRFLLPHLLPEDSDINISTCRRLDSKVRCDLKPKALPTAVIAFRPRAPVSINDKLEVGLHTDVGTTDVVDDNLDRGQNVKLQVGGGGGCQLRLTCFVGESMIAILIQLA